MPVATANVRYALRGLRQRPAFASIAIATLALAVGAATTVFSVVNGELLRPLPYREPERLVNVWNDFGQGAQSLPAVSAGDFRDYRRMATRFEGFAAGTGSGDVGMTGIVTDAGAPPEHVDLSAVSANLFPLLGVRPALGRAFTADDEALAGARV